MQNLFLAEKNLFLAEQNPFYIDTYKRKLVQKDQEIENLKAKIRRMTVSENRGAMLRKTMQASWSSSSRLQPPTAAIQRQSEADDGAWRKLGNATDEAAIE